MLLCKFSKTTTLKGVYPDRPILSWAVCFVEAIGYSARIRKYVTPVVLDRVYLLYSVIGFAVQIWDFDVSVLVISNASNKVVVIPQHQPQLPQLDPTKAWHATAPPGLLGNDECITSPSPDCSYISLVLVPNIIYRSSVNTHLSLQRTIPS